ncbi:hypothetical protein ASD93_00005, partial [Microbacterium sp. Root180]
MLPLRAGARISLLIDRRVRISGHRLDEVRARRRHWAIALGVEDRVEQGVQLPGDFGQQLTAHR